VSLLHLLSVSFITEWWHRSFCQGRKIANREEREFAHIIDDICKKARIKRPTILVNNDESVNAYALGRRTIVLNKGCFTLIDRDQLAAIIAHEIAHLKVGDSVCSISAITMLSVPLFSERFPRLINVIGVFFKPAKLLHLLSLPLLPAYWLFNYLFLPLWNPLIILIGRRAEFRADALAAKWVGKKKVISLLEYLEKNNVEQDGNMWGRLYESHPFTIYRLDNVDALQD
jgi:heat shock protein HtpX